MSVEIISSDIKSLKTFQKTLQGAQNEMCTATAFCLSPSDFPHPLKSPPSKGTFEDFMEYPLCSPMPVLIGNYLAGTMHSAKNCKQGLRSMFAYTRCLA